MRARIRIYVILFVVFLASGLITLYVTSRPRSASDKVSRISLALEKELQQMDHYAAGIISELKNSGVREVPPSAPYSFYIFNNYRLTSWNDHLFVPRASAMTETFTVRLLRDGNSDYLARKWIVDNNTFVVGIMPLYRRYQISNHYLEPQRNENVFRNERVSIHDPSAADGIPVCVSDNCPFKVTFLSASATNEPLGLLAVVFIWLAVITLLVLCFELLQRYLYPDLVFVIFLGLLLVVRFLMTALEFPRSFVESNLFDPLQFAASRLNASLGDLLINEVALFFLCFYLFRNFFRFRLLRHLSASWARWLLSFFSATLIFFAMLFPFVVVQTIYNNSSLALGISESLEFSGMRIAALIAVALAGLCTFFFSHCFIRILIGDGNRGRILVSFLFGSVVFFLVNNFSGQIFLPTVVVTVLYFLVVYALDLTASLRKLSFTTFTYFFVCIFFMSVNAAFAMHHFARQEKIANMFRFGSNYLVERDYFAEYLLRDLSEKVAADVFIQSRVATPFLSKDAVKQKVRQVFIPSYFNKYDIEIFTFNAIGESSDNHPDRTLGRLLARYGSQGTKTDYEGVHFLSNPAEDVSQRYLVAIPVTWMRSLAGYVVIELSLKKVIPESVYPELLVDNRFLESFRTQELNYAVYTGNRLLFSSGSFNYQGMFNTSWFGDPALHTTGITRNGFDHVAEEDDAGRIAIVSSQATPVAYIIANFSFLLVIGLSTILIFIFLQSMISYWQGGKLYFAARIQLFLNLAFFLPLVIVSVMSLRVTNKSSENQMYQEYLSRTRRFSEQIASQLHRSLVTSFEPMSSFANDLTDLAALANLDANIYYINGTLLGTSQPLIFENNLLSGYLNPSAFRRIKNGDDLFIEVEKLGRLEYYSAYAALKAPTSGAVIGIVGVPFFQSVYSYEKNQIGILANILNIFALVFVILVALSYFVTRWLTFPLTFITQSLRRTSLTKTNQPLVWKSDDEIGLMVKEYNQMLYSLSESKAELEQTQRESAWREMAQQVAHEIKNPLTPMKLTLQQLERSNENGKAGPEKVQKAVASLLAQVHTLNDIASSFSAFAKMPEPVMKPLEITALLRRIVDLHSHEGELRLDVSPGEIWIHGDEQLLGRTFSNIILNAFQSAVPGDVIKVDVKATTKAERLTITFQDNGRGIEPDVAGSIFTPHFTTKKSGSGLGLAIARQAIEHMKGRIWFTTELGKGSVFYIELPLAKDGPLSAS